MTDFVLDNSVTMRWLLASDNDRDQAYAEAVLESMREGDAVIPQLWHLEVANVLFAAEARREIGSGQSEAFVSRLEGLPLRVDELTAAKAFSRTLALGRTYRLSSYDAAYLELANREGLPLATLDRTLRKAARKASVGVHLSALQGAVDSHRNERRRSLTDGCLYTQR